VSERSEVQFGTTRIPFSIRRSQRRKTVALTIEPPGRLLVTAPFGVSVDKLNGVVRSKAPWVVERIKRASDRPPPPPERELVTGETVLYLGRQLRLKVVERAGDEPPRMRKGWYEVPIPPGLQGEARRREVHHRLAASLRGHAALYLPKRLAALCRRARIKAPPMVVREQKKRWGSCDARGTLRINWRIIQAPPSLVDYVLAHEVAHVEHPSHGPAFWAALGRIMPDYEARRAVLRRVGGKLEW